MQHRNNFDFLRLLFATLVIITHSVVLTGRGEQDFLSNCTGGQISCSYLGVRGFFIISGFLVFISLERSRDVLIYLKKRLLRIFPGLIAMLLVITFIAGPLLSTLSFHEYFTNSQTFHYFTSALRIPRILKTDSLPGVFTKNPFGTAVNGSLWTVWFELLFYILLLAFSPFLKKQNWLKWILPIVWLFLFGLFLYKHTSWGNTIFPFTGMSTEVVLDLAQYFFGGAALTRLPWRSWKELRWFGIGIGLLLIIAGLSTGSFVYLRYLALPILIIAIGNSHLPTLSSIRRFGEPSYGIYIYAYPVQQAIIQCFHTGPLFTTLLTIPVSFAAGYASWHVVEKHFLKSSKQ